ncbi:hypothetical protein WJX72_004171 [[Myrmecia] bisecta]|uniref:Uncharacterized protein n=1 Tax=[Myrmecia] bisecta TaxID=41462 RepID=A0AAW1NZY4_9CHLO
MLSGALGLNLVSACVLRGSPPLSHGSITERMMQAPEKVMPVFYDVEPGLQQLLADVARFDGSYHSDKLAEWQAALKGAPAITGWRLDQTGRNVPQLTSSWVTCGPWSNPARVQARCRPSH